VRAQHAKEGLLPSLTPQQRVELKLGTGLDRCRGEAQKCLKNHGLAGNVPQMHPHPVPLPLGEGWGEGDKKLVNPYRGTVWTSPRLLRQFPCVVLTDQITAHLGTGRKFLLTTLQAASKPRSVQKTSEFPTSHHWRPRRQWFKIIGGFGEGSGERHSCEGRNPAQELGPGFRRDDKCKKGPPRKLFQKLAGFDRISSMAFRKYHA